MQDAGISGNPVVTQPYGNAIRLRSVDANDENKRRQSNTVTFWVQEGSKCCVAKARRVSGMPSLSDMPKVVRL